MQTTLNVQDNKYAMLLLHTMREELDECCKQIGYITSLCPPVAYTVCAGTVTTLLASN